MTVVLNRAQVAQLASVFQTEAQRPDGRLTVYEHKGSIVAKADQDGSPQGEYVVTDHDHVWTATTR